MSLFYQKTSNSERARARKESRIPVKVLQSKRCEVCYLDEADICSPKMEAKGPEDAEVYIIGSKPTESDDEKGKHFSGDVGQLVRNYTPSAWKRDVRLNYITRCHTKETHEKKVTVHTEACKGFLIEDIERVKPKLILGIGYDPLRFVSDGKAMSYGGPLMSWRGRMFPVQIGNHVCWYKQIDDPLIVYQKQSVSKKTKKRYPSTSDDFMRRDIKEACDLVEYNALPLPFVHTKDTYLEKCEWLEDTDDSAVDTIVEWLEQFLDYDALTIDLETTALRPYSGGRILSIAIGDDTCTKSFLWEHKDGFDKDLQNEITDIITDFLMTFKGSLIYHNGAFDLEWLAYRCGKEILRANAVHHCTQVGAYIMDNRKGMLNLDTQVYLYFGFFLKAVSGVKRDNLEAEPIPVLLKYNAMDTKYTHMLWLKQQEAIRKDRDYKKLLNTYNAKIRTMVTLVLSQLKGVMPNNEALDRFGKQLDQEIIDIKAEVATLRDVKRFRRVYNRDFDCGSDLDLEAMFKDLLKRPEVMIPNEKKKGQKKFSTSEAILKSIPKDEVPLARLVLAYRSPIKLNSTYIDGTRNVIHTDGLLHTSYSQTFTATGRLSSSEPNSQNFPKRKSKWIREIIGTPPDHKMVSADYGQIEARVFGMASQDKVFCKALWNNLDIHYDWAVRIAEAYNGIMEHTIDKYDMDQNADDKSVLKKIRGDVKNGWVFPQFFGGSAYSSASALAIPVDIAETLAEEFWSEFEGVKKWQEKTVKFYEKNGYVETLGGFRRSGVMGFNEVINAPIQGTACEIVLWAMNELSEMHPLDDPRQNNTQANLQIHDDLTFYLPDATLDSNIDEIARKMCTCPFEYINVPLVAEVEVGDHWANQKVYGEFSSNNGWDKAA